MAILSFGIIATSRSHILKWLTQQTIHRYCRGALRATAKAVGGSTRIAPTAGPTTSITLPSTAGQLMQLPSE
eukprot:6068639-Prymnesium_polylepis.1